MYIKSAKEFGVLVRSEREKRGWSQSQLAAKVGVSLPWVSQFERGKSKAQIDLVLKTLRVLEIPLWAGEPASPAKGRAPVIDLDDLLNQLSSPAPDRKDHHTPGPRAPKA